MNAKEFLSKYGVWLGLGAVLLYLVNRMSSTGSDQQIINRVIPTQVNVPPSDKLGLTQLGYEFELGKQRLLAEAGLADKQLEAEKLRLEYGNQAIQLQGNIALRSLELENQRAANNSELSYQIEKERNQLAREGLLSNNYDNELRYNALSEAQRQQQNQNLLNNIFGLGSGLLNALLNQQKQQQQQQGRSSGSPSIGSGGGSSLPLPTRTASNANNLASRLSAYLNSIYGRNQSALVPYSEYEPADFFGIDNWYDDGSIFDQRYFDWLTGSGQDLIGTVTSDFQGTGLAWYDNPFWNDYFDYFGEQG